MTVSAALPRPRHSRNTRERPATVIAIRDTMNIGIHEDCEPRGSRLLPLRLMFRLRLVRRHAVLTGRRRPPDAAF
jgi:hypothetical protein